MHKKAFPGMWTVPGGGLTTDDYVHTKSSSNKISQWYGALSNSLQREIKEETGVKIGKPELLCDITYIRGDGIPVIIFSYFAKYISGEIKMDEDTIDFAWVTVPRAKKYDLIDGILGEIRDVEKILKKRK